jgi:hypothetical protein
VDALPKLSVIRTDSALSLEIFLYLQVLDVLTTWLGFRMGGVEVSPFIRYLMHVGPMAGLLGSKLIAVGLGAYCVWRQRLRVIQIINYFFAALVLWNLTQILTN